MKMRVEPERWKKRWLLDAMKLHKPALPPEFCLPLTPSNLAGQRCPVPREQASHRILIMRAGAFGDILMGTPLLAALRQAYPNAHLTWLVEHTEVQAIEANPYIDEYLRWDSAYWKKMLRRGLFPLWLLRALRFQKTLREKNYDVFISFQPEEWSLLVRGIGAALSVGIFDTFRRYYRAARTSRNTHLYTHAYAYPNLPNHRIDQYLLTLQALGLPTDVSRKMSIGYTSDDAASVEHFLSTQGVLAGERLVMLAPATTWPTKCWPPERYTELADLLTAWYDCRIVVIGSGKERDAIKRLASQMRRPPVIAAGDLTFREMAALMDRTSLLVSGDTGPMHVASALGIPQIALFGPTSPSWYGPKAGQATTLLHPVPCGPCDQKICPNKGDDHVLCMRLITVEEVTVAASRYLKQFATAE